MKRVGRGKRGKDKITERQLFVCGVHSQEECLSVYVLCPSVSPVTGSADSGLRDSAWQST